jgi:hypothetical protein
VKAGNRSKKQLKRKGVDSPKGGGVVPIAPTTVTDAGTKRHHIVRTSLCLTQVEQQKLEELRIFLYGKGSGLVSTTALLQIAIRSVSISDELVDIATAIKAEDRRRCTSKVRATRAA